MLTNNKHPLSERFLDQKKTITDFNNRENNEKILSGITQKLWQPSFYYLAFNPITTFILYVTINQLLLEFTHLTPFPRSLLVGAGSSLGSITINYCNHESKKTLITKTIPLFIILSCSPIMISFMLALAGPSPEQGTDEVKVVCDIFGKSILVALAGIILSTATEIISIPIKQYWQEENSFASACINIGAYTLCYFIFGLVELAGQRVALDNNYDDSLKFKLGCGILGACLGGASFAAVTQFQPRAIPQRADTKRNSFA